MALFPRGITGPFNTGTEAAVDWLVDENKQFAEYLQGQDAKLATIAAHVDQISSNNDFFTEGGASVYAERGALSSSDGTSSSSTTRVRTSFLPRGSTSVAPANGYKLMVFGYKEDGTYLGVYNGETFANTGSWKTEEIDLPSKDYLYRLVIANAGDTTITAADAQANVTITASADNLLAAKGFPADAAAVGFIANDLRRGSYNVLNPNSPHYGATYKASGVTFRPDMAGTWYVSGTATANGFQDIVMHEPVPAGVYKAVLNGGTVPLRVFIERTGESDIVKNYTTDGYFSVPAGATITARLMSTNGTTYNTSVKYAIIKIADTEDYVKGILTSTGDTTDRKADIEFYLTTIGYCILDSGVFYVSGVAMSDNSMLSGRGWSSIIQLSGSSAGSAIAMASACTVADLDIRGTDSPLEMPPPSSDGGRNGIVFDGTGYTGTKMQGTVHNCHIHDFTGSGILMQKTGVSSMGGVNVSDCNIERNFAGVNIAERSEFHRFTNCSMTQNRHGCINNGGNNQFACCGFNSNIINFEIDNSAGDKYNNSHGAAVGCNFHHANSRAIKIDGSLSGFCFTGCNLDDEGILLKNSTRIMFAGCNFMATSFSLTVDGSGSHEEGGEPVDDGNLLIFSGCSFRKNFTSMTLLNDADEDGIIFNACYYEDGTAVSPTVV